MDILVVKDHTGKYVVYKILFVLTVRISFLHKPHKQYTDVARQKFLMITKDKTLLFPTITTLSK